MLEMYVMHESMITLVITLQNMLFQYSSGYVHYSL